MTRLKLFRIANKEASSIVDVFPDCRFFGDTVIGIRVETASESVRKVLRSLASLPRRPKQVIVTPPMFFRLFVTTFLVGGDVGEVNFSTEIDEDYEETFREALQLVAGSDRKEATVIELLKEPFYDIIDEYECYVDDATIFYGTGFARTRIHVAANGIVTASNEDDNHKTVSRILSSVLV